jgi:hypothetical protein
MQNAPVVSGSSRASASWYIVATAAPKCTKQSRTAASSAGMVVARLISSETNLF